MGVPSYGDKLAKLIKVLRDFGYEWLILTIFAVKDYHKLSYEQKISLIVKPHKVKISDQETVSYTHLTLPTKRIV